MLSRRRPQIYGLAEFKPKLLLSRPEIYSKPAWGSSLMDTGPESRSSTQGKGMTLSIALANAVAVGQECHAICLGIGIVLPPLNDVLREDGALSEM